MRNLIEIQSLVSKLKLLPRRLARPPHYVLFLYTLCREFVTSDVFLHHLNGWSQMLTKFNLCHGTTDLSIQNVLLTGAFVLLVLQTSRDGLSVISVLSPVVTAVTYHRSVCQRY
jgi:hypothetical protein